MVWTLQIQSIALRSSQCTCYIASNDEYNLTRVLDHEVVVYLDDILIYSKTLEEYKKLVKQVLARLELQDLAVSLKKSVFHVDTVEFLGYIVGKDGVTMSEKNVESI